MINVTIILDKNCPKCPYILQILNRLEGEYDLAIIEVDSDSEYGQELFKKYNADKFPLILMNNKFFSMGEVTEKQLVDHINQIRSHFRT